MQRVLLLLCWFLLWGPPNAAAYGPRGALERIFYYYCYLAEEIYVDNDSQRQVGVGCAGSRAGGRCTFNEFIEYIWSAKTDGGVTDTTRPTGIAVLEAGADFTQQDVVTLRQAVDEYKAPNTGQKITWNIDPDRVFSGTSTYQDALGGIGDRLGRLDENLGNLAETIKTNGQNTVKLLYDMRMSQFEKFRKPYILSVMGMSQDELKLVDGRNTLGGNPRVRLIDAAATIRAKVGGPNFPEEFRSQMEAAKSFSTSASEHWAAIAAADRAQLGAGCG